MPRVLLAGKDWKLRALLRAQLKEEGVEVIALENAREALNSLTGLANLPKLLVADLTDSSHPAAEVDLLVRWTSILPIWLVLSRTVTLSHAIDELGFERAIYRPVDMARLVQEIKERAQK
ncbi:MAG TPA: hypothetical protein VKV79_04575 [Terriglobia bacterium]|nr:hypothetical protein [Terriglobia bacterium]